MSSDVFTKTIFFFFHQRITEEVAPEVQQFLVIHLEGPPACTPGSTTSPQVS